MKKIDKLKSWFFKKTNKIYKPLVRQIMKKRENTTYQHQE